MQRTIKFRAWDKTLNKIHCWSTIENHFTLEELLDDNFFEAMQYTGLKDEYDTEIYEGDIVEIAEQPLLRFEIVYSTEHAAFMRRWLSSLVSVTRECGSEEHIPPNTTFWKVIGNRYENPELLR